MVQDISLIENAIDDLHRGRAGASEIEVFDAVRPEDVWEGTEWEADLADHWYQRARAMNISFRYVVTPQIARQPLLRNLSRRLEGQVQWRVLGQVPMRMVVQNGLVITSMDPASHRSSALVAQADAARVGAWQAEELWRRARPWSAERAALENVRNRAVRALLMEGFDDEAVARRLGVSVRTVRRDVADLMTEHGAKSRLQLGVALAAGL